MGASFEVLDVQVLEFICGAIFYLTDGLTDPNVNYGCTCVVFYHTQSSLTSVIFSVDFTSTGLGSSLPTEMVAVTCHMTFWFIFGVGTCPRMIVTAGCTEKENNSDKATSEK